MYDTSIGNSVDSSGFADLPLRSGAKRFFVRNGHASASDTHTITQAQDPTTPLSTIGKALTYVTDSAGDQVLVAQGTTYSEALPELNGKRGFSSLYPTVIQTYDPADSLNEAKYGRASAGNRPTFTYTGIHYFSQFTSGLSSQPAGNLVLRGFDFPAGAIEFIPSNYINGPVLIENCIFRGVGGVFQQEGNIGQLGMAPRFIFRNCSTYSQWTPDADGTSLYISNVRNVTLEDNFFYHNGWKEGASRDDTKANGGLEGAGARRHAYYVQEDCGAIVSRRNLIVDASYDGGMNRSSTLAEQNVYIDNPQAVVMGGGIFSYYITKPTGVDLDFAFNFTIGDADASTDQPMRWGVVMSNGRLGSATRKNVFARSNDLTATNSSVFSTDARANVPSYSDFRNNISYQRVSSGRTTATGGDFPAQDFPTYETNTWDDPASGTNVNISTYTPTNAYTAATLYAALTATFASITDKTSLIAYAKDHPEAHVQRTLWSLGWAGYNGPSTATTEDLTTKIDLTSGLQETSVFIGTVPGSTLTTTGLPSFLTIDSATRSWSYDGTAHAAASGTFTVTETPPSGSAHTSTIPYAISVPPALSSPSVSGVTSTTATLNVTTDTGNGSLYYIVDTHPTWWDGRRGDILNAFSTNGQYQSADKSGTQAVSSTGAKTISVTGLTSATTYVAYVVHKNAAGYVSSASYLGSFTTSASGSATKWNTSTDTPPSSANWTVSGASNNIGTYSSGSGDALLRASAPLTAGKSYDITWTSGSAIGPGVCTSSFSTTQWVGNVGGSCAYGSDGSIYLNSSVVSTGATYTVGDKIRVAYDGTNIQFYKLISGSFVAQGSPINISATISAPYPATNGVNGVVVTADFTNS